MSKACDPASAVSERKNIVPGVAHVNSTFNNDDHHHRRARQHNLVVLRRHYGVQGAQVDPVRRPDGGRGCRQESPEHGMRTLEVEVSGPGSGRES